MAPTTDTSSAGERGECLPAPGARCTMSMEGDLENWSLRSAYRIEQNQASSTQDPKCLNLPGSADKVPTPVTSLTRFRQPVPSTLTVPVKYCEQHVTTIITSPLGIEFAALSIAYPLPPAAILLRTLSCSETRLPP